MKTSLIKLKRIRRICFVMLLVCFHFITFKAAAQTVDLFKLQDEQDKKEKKRENGYYHFYI